MKKISRNEKPKRGGNQKKGKQKRQKQIKGNPSEKENQ